ncbi:MAG TPA: nuclear transport factor 2 family protein [Acidimicrobiales bacterium]|nr:nuclear transport factor 2 family protein [Acidimicrobiales bacterium]
MTSETSAPGTAIESAVARWHRHLRGDLPGGLDELLHDDVVFYSPIVYTPQVGKAVTKLYLEAAGQALPGDQAGAEDSEPASDSRRFRYTKTVTSGDVAVLEFETTIEGKYVNGVDIIRCDTEGRIVEFRVMIRPLQAVNLVHAQMAATLETMRHQGQAAAPLP